MKEYEVKIKVGRLSFVKFLLAFGILCAAIFSIKAQSINQSYPTPITTNELSGKILARDLGDARLTSYFYTFDGKQGDIFINVVTTNFNGDIDVFIADNLRPLTKITIYSDDSDKETGRVVYLRQPTKLILRIEGRTPDDDSATFRIKFAGSFIPSTAIADTSASETPEVKSNNQTDVRVNSVGTIIEVKPRPTPPPRINIAKKNDKTTEKTADSKKTINEEKSTVSEVSKVKTEVKEPESKTTITIEKNPTETKENPDSEAETKPTEPKPEVIITDKIAEKENGSTSIEIKKDAPEDPELTVDKTIAKEEPITAKKPEKSKKTKAVQSPPSSALENIRLIVLFKDGTKIERPMSDVLKVGVDKGILTVISKDGAIGRYSILDVEKMTIE